MNASIQSSKYVRFSVIHLTLLVASLVAVLIVTPVEAKTKAGGDLRLAPGEREADPGLVPRTREHVR